MTIGIIYSLVALAVVFALRHKSAARPRCWRCSGPTDSPGAPCATCRDAIHAERIRRMGLSGHVPLRMGKRDIDGATGFPVAPR